MIGDTETHPRQQTTDSATTYTWIRTGANMELLGAHDASPSLSENLTLFTCTIEYHNSTAHPEHLQCAHPCEAFLMPPRGWCCQKWTRFPCKCRVGSRVLAVIYDYSNKNLQASFCSLTTPILPSRQDVIHFCLRLSLDSLLRSAV